MQRPTIARCATLALAILALGACSSATEPAPPVLSVLIGAAEASPETSPIEVNGANVVFRGAMLTPCLSYSIRTDLERSADGYVVTLRGKQSGELCATAIGRYPYIGTLFDVPTGNPRVIVRHVIEDANWPADTVIDTRVVVR